MNRNFSFKLVSRLMGGVFCYGFGKSVIFLLMAIGFLGSCSEGESRYVKGNVHTHTYWSDGDDFPERVARWYKDHGYDFLVMTDHNMILEGEKWRSFPEGHEVLAKYREEFGDEWVIMRPDTAKEGNVLVRLKTLDEFRNLYERQDSFLLVMGNEISNPHAVHLVTINKDRVVPYTKGTADEREFMISETVRLMADYRKETGINSFPVLAHPNFTWALTAEMILNNPDIRFFEVYNGHPLVNNEGDGSRAGTERMWDIILAHRTASDGLLLYGLATDDAHNYHGGGAGPGKGWIMVRSDELTTDGILHGLDSGDFYASTGVVLKGISFDGKKLSIRIDGDPGTEYSTEFIGTRKGFDPSSTAALDSAGLEIPNTTRVYSNEIGAILAADASLNPSYTFTGDELYVRVRITSSKDHLDPNSGKVLGKQKAWVQPHIAAKR